MQEDAKVIYCAGCGAPLNVEINRAFIFCQYCGCKNIIQDEKMKASVRVNGGTSISANTDIDSLLNTVDYLISCENYDQANEYLTTLFVSGCNDYRAYIYKAMIALRLDNNRALFESMDKLMMLESAQQGREVTDAICRLMQYRGINGVTVLHNATFHELYNMVVYCVEHGANVNQMAGMNRVTPISIMFVPISRNLSKLDGTPFIRNKAIVKQIRKYLMAHGAVDGFRLGY